MSDQDELDQLEAERNRLLSMIAYHNSSYLRMSSGIRAPEWFVVIAIAILCGIGAMMVAGIFAGQISASSILLLVVALSLLAYFSMRKITVFGNSFLVAEILAGWPGRPPAGEPEVLQRLAACEARIARLKEGRSS